MTRTQRLMPKGTPRYIRIYDNGGGTFDRYTVVFTGRYRHKTAGSYLYLGMSTYPYDPQGFGQHGESKVPVDRDGYKHLGTKITFADLPEDCRRLVRDEYRDLWNLEVIP